MPQAKRKPAASKKFTYADYCTWPEEVRCELIDGVVYDMTPAPSVLHATISINLATELNTFFRDTPCRVFAAPFDVRFPKKNERDEEIDTVLQPDIVVICDEAKLDDKGCRGAPDLVIEILSPSTASRDHITKKRLYEKHGVKEYWLVSPTDRIVTVYRLEADGEFGKPDVFADADTVKVPLFPGLEIDLAKVFPPLPKVVRELPAIYRHRR